MDLFNFGSVEVLVFGIVIVLSLLVVLTILKRKGTTIIKVPTFVGYRVRDKVMNDSEAVFFDLLSKELPAGFHVFPKMRIADILETIGGEGYIYRRNKILPKHIDFLICDSNFKPVIAIELDGKSHDAPDRVSRDKFVDDLFENCNLKLIRVIVGGDFKMAIQAIVNVIENK
jgi:Protein of unknown function (DUF2726)